MAFLEGYGVGLGLVVLIGPVLFVLVQTTLSRGRKAGFFVALGIFVSDVVAVSLCWWGLGPFLDESEVQFWFGLLGGTLLMAFGFKYLWRPQLLLYPYLTVSVGQLARAFLKGFLVNFVNPFVFMVWLGIIAGGSLRYGSGMSLGWFLAGCILAVLSLDGSKVILAHRIAPFLNPRVLKVVFRLSGLVLVGFGIRLVILAYSASISMPK